jgi:hypothetical protein
LAAVWHASTISKQCPAAAACSNQPVISTTEHLNTAASRSQAMSCSTPLIIHLQAKESFRTDIGKGTWLYAGYHLATTIATPAACE